MKKIATLIGVAATAILFPISTLVATIVFNNYIGKVYMKNVKIAKITIAEFFNRRCEQMDEIDRRCKSRFYRLMLEV